MTEKLYLDHEDIQKLFDCGKNKAYEIIQSVKVVSNTLNIKGKITRKDLDVWIEQCGKTSNVGVNYDT